MPAPFTPGNVVLYRVGDGSGSLSASAAPVFLDEYSPTGSLVQSLPVPTSASGTNNPLTSGGTTTSEGMLTLSADGRYLVVPGYAAAPGTASVANSAVPRVVGRVDASGNVDTSTTTTAFTSNIRGAASADGTGYWAVGNGGGVVYTAHGASGAGSTVSTTVTNLRTASVVGGQLYVSTGSGTAVRVGTVGSGTPTTAGQTITNLPGFTTSSSPYQFVFADLSAAVAGFDTLYVADDTAGQIQKYSLVGGNWVPNNTVALTVARGITATVTGTTVKLFVAASSASPTGSGTLYSLTDASGYNSNITASLVSLASAAANTSFRGIALVPRVSITLSPSSLPGGNQGTTYSQTLTASGGYGNYSIAVTSGSLPTGLSLSSAGVLSGTPTAASTFNFRVTATEGTFSGFRDYTVVIGAGATVTVAPAGLPNPTLQVAYSQTLTAAGGTAPYTFAVSSGALPTGLTLAADGVLSGTPTAAGTYTFTTRATDNGGTSGTRQYTLTVPLTVTPDNLPDGTRGVAYSQSLAASGGTAPYTFAVTAGALPTGLTLSTAGVVSGTPTVANTFNFTVTATDAGGTTGTRAYTVVVAPSASVASIVRVGGSPTNAATVSWTVTFSQAVSGLTAGNFTLTDLTSSITGEAITSVTAVGGAPVSNWTVTASSGTAGDGTLRLNVTDPTGVSPTVIDLPTAVTTADYAVDRTAPTVSIGAPSVSLAAGGPVMFTVTYGGADEVTLAAGGVTLNRTGTADASVAVTGSGSTRTVTLSGITGNGTLGISLAAGTASDTAGNLAPAADPSLTVQVDNTPPTVSSVVRAGGPTVTNAGSVQYTVTFSEPVSGVGTDSFTPVITGSLAGVSVTGVSGGPTAYTVTVGTGSGDGTIRLDVPAGTSVTDAAGNPIAVAFNAGELFTVDRTAPAVAIGAPSAPVVRGGPVSFTITYSDPNLSTVTLGTSDVTLVRTGTANAAVSVSGTGNTRTVTLSEITGDGTLAVALAGGTATDAAGNTAPAPGTSGPVQVDNTAPAITGVVRTGSPATTNASSVQFDVTFSEDVSGLTAGSFTPVPNGTLAGVVVTGVTGGPRVYTVTVATGTGDGTIRLDVPVSATITDAAGNTLGTGFTGGESYTLDRTAPTVLSVVRVGTTPTNAGGVSFNITFSEPVTGVGVAAFGLTSSGLSSPAVTDVSGSGATRTVTVSTGTGDGTLRLDVLAGTSVADAAGNRLAATYTAGESYFVDRSAPIVTSITRAGESPTNATSVAFTITFREPVTGVDAGDFTLSTAGLAGASITSVTPGPAVRSQTFTVTVDAGSGDGTLELDLADNDTILDAAGNRLGGTGLGTGNFTGPVYTVDRTVPTVVSVIRSNGGGEYSNAGSVLFTVTFSEDVSGVTAAHFTPAGTLPGAMVTGVNQIDARTFAVTVGTGSGEGILRLDVPATADVVDAARNPVATGFAAGESYTLDRTTPAVTVGPPSVTLARGGPVTFTVTYADASPLDVALIPADVTLVTTGTASVTVAVSGTGTVRTLTLSDISGDGTLALSLAEGTAVDAAGNATPAAGPSETVTVDNLAPAVVSVVRTGPGPTNAVTVTFIVTFDEDVPVPGPAAFSIAAPGTVSNTTVTDVIPVDARTCAVTVGTGTGDGTIRLDVPAGTGVKDFAGNPLSATFSAGETYTVLKSNPTVVTSYPTDGEVVGPAGYDGFVVGTAADALGGVVSSVAVAIRRWSDESFWTGTGWDTNGSLVAVVTGTAWSVPFPAFALDTGDTYTITSTATDVAGNATVAPAVMFQWDAAPPGGTVALPSPVFGPSTWGGAVGGPVADAGPAGVAAVDVVVTRSSDGFSYDAATDTWVEDIITTEVTVGGGGWSLLLTTAQLTHGVTYTVTAAARDAAGNVQSPSATAPFSFDAVAPVSAVTTPAATFSGPNTWPAANQLGGTVTDTGAAGVAGVAVWVTRSSDGFFWNGTDWQAARIDLAASVAGGEWDYTLPAAGLTNGLTYTIESAAVDAAGNAQIAPSNRSFTWDEATPALLIIAPADGSITGPASFAGLTGTAVDPGATASGVTAVSLTLTRRSDGLAWDGTAFVAGSPTLTADVNAGLWALDFDPAYLADGETYDLSVTARDRALNAVTATTRFTFDAAGPVTTITGPAAGATATASAWTGLTGHATDAGAGVERVEYRVMTAGGLVWDGAAFGTTGNWFTAAGTGSWTTSFPFANFPADGGYRVETRGVDAVGNVGPVAAADFAVILPTVTGIVPQSPADPITNTVGPVTWRVTFSDPVAGVTAANFALDGSFAGASAVTTVTPVGGTTPAREWDVTVAIPAAGTGSLGLIFVTAANLIPVVSTAAFSGVPYTLDRVAPTVVVSNDAPASVVRVGLPIRYTVTFDDDTALDSVEYSVADVANAAATGGAPFVVSNFTAIGANNFTFDVTPTGEGVFQLELVAPVVSDAAGNTLAVPVTDAHEFVADGTAPVVGSVVPVGLSPTNAPAVAYTVTFSEDVTGVDAADFVLTTAGAVGPTGVTVTPVSGTIYTVTVDTGPGDGTLRLDVLSDGTVRDAAGNPLAAGFTAAAAVIIDKTAPTAAVDLDPAQSALTNAQPVRFVVTFSEPVSGFGPAGVVLGGSAGGLAAAATAVENPSGDSRTFTVAVSALTGSGAVTVSVAGGAAADAAGNVFSAAVTSPVVALDTAAPVAVSLVCVTPSPTNADAVTYRVTFSEAVTGVDAGDFDLATDGLAGASVAGVSGAGIDWVIAVNAGTGDGDLRLDLRPDATVADLAGNPLATGGLAGAVVVIDRTGPTAAVAAPSPALRNAPLRSVAVTFDEAVIGLDVSAFTLTRNGVPLDLSAASLTGGGANYALGNLAGLTGLDGEYVLTLSAHLPAVVDAAGNPLAADVSVTFTVDVTPPTVTITPAVSGPTKAAAVLFIVAFSETVTGVDSDPVGGFDHFVVTGTAPGAAVIAVSAGVGGVYAVAVSTGSGEGTVGLTLAANTAVTDLAGNPVGGLPAAGGFAVVDHVRPTVVITDADADGLVPVGVPVVLTVDVLDAGGVVGGLTAADFSNAGTAVVSIGSVIASAVAAGVRYTVPVTPITGGTLLLRLNAGAALADAAGNAPTLPVLAGRTLVVDAAAPTVTVARAPGQAAVTNSQPVRFAVTFSEPVVGFDGSMLVPAGAAVEVTGGGQDYIVSVSGLTADGPVTLTVPAGVVTDLAGNPNAASTGPDNVVTFDTAPPAVGLPVLVRGSDTGAADGVTADATPTFTGTAEPGVGVGLYEGGTLLGTMTATADGRWTITTPPLADGPHAVFARATDAAGNVVHSAPIAVTIDTTPPTVAVVRAPDQPAAVLGQYGGISVVFAVRTSEPVDGLDPAALTVCGATGGAVTAVGGSGTDYLVTVGGITRPGVVTLAVAAGAGADLAGNQSRASAAGESVAVRFETSTLVTLFPGEPRVGDPVPVGVLVTHVADAGATGAVTLTLTGPAGTLTRILPIPRPTPGPTPGVDPPPLATWGSAAVTFTDLPAGEYTATAVFAGTGGFLDSGGSAAFTVVPAPPVGQNSTGVFAAVTGTTVSVFEPDGSARDTAVPFTREESQFGARVAVADVTGDGVPDLVAGTAPGAPAAVRVLDGATGAVVLSVPVFEGFTGGVVVAAGDLTGDGRSDIVVTPDMGGGPRVLVLDGATGRQLASFLGIQDPNFRGGARAAVGDLNRDGIADVLVSAGFGGGPRVAGFDGTTVADPTPRKLFDDFFLFAPDLRDGAYVAVGDLDGDGYADVIGGAGPGGAPRVLALSGRALVTTGVVVPLADFFAGPTDLRGGVRVAAKDLGGDRRAGLVTGSGDTGEVRVYPNAALLSPEPQPSARFDLIPGILPGVQVG